MRFGQWLQQQMDARGLGVRELARIAKVNPGTISRLMTETRNPGPELCKKLAKALEIPEAIVFVEAGLMSPARTASEGTLRELYELLRDLPLEEQRAILDEARQRWQTVHGKPASVTSP